MSPNRANTRVSEQTKKRRRHGNVTTVDANNSGVPMINNVSANVVPLLLQAVKIQKKIISQKHKLSLNDGNIRKFTSSNVISVQTKKRKFLSAQEIIFERMENTQDAGPLQDQIEEANHRCTLLLNEIDKEASELPAAEIDEEDIPTNCATGCLDFLMGLVSDENCKIILRNASLCVINILVQYRNDCRAMLTAKIKPFLDSVGDADEHLRLNSNGTIGKRDHVVMYQRDALQFLYNLSGSFGSVQPKLVIAGRYLEEQKGISLFAGSSSLLGRKTNSDMTELRKIRDIALAFTDKEVKGVTKALEMVGSCFDILVPRFGHTFQMINEENSHKESNEIDEDNYDNIIVEDEGDGDDDDIDWEDGEDCDSITTGINKKEMQNKTCICSTEDHSKQKEDRRQAVERTLSVMKQSGALKNDGTLDVAFGNTEEAPQASPSSSRAIELEESRAKLSKCIKFLSKRLKKISLWIDALVSADNMTDARRLRSSSMHDNNQLSGTSSVVLLPQSIRKKKGVTRRKLMSLKYGIVNALSAEIKMRKSEITQEEEADNLCSQQLPRQSYQSQEGENNSLQPWQYILQVKPKAAFAVSQNRRNTRSGKSRLLIKLRP